MKKLLVVAGCFLAAASLIGYIVLGMKINKHEQTTANGSNDYLIILGAKVKPNGDPSLSLQMRLETAIPYLQQHEHVRVIVSGGKGADEPQSEASVMLAYLKTNGIDRSRIIVEDKSTSTYENLAFSKKLLPENVNTLTIVSNDFHLARAQFLAKQLGFETDTLAAPTPKSVAWHLSLRERAALCKTYVVGK